MCLLKYESRWRQATLWWSQKPGKSLCHCGIAMASWDGSYYGPEDPNFHRYSDQGNVARNWSYYPENGSNVQPSISNLGQQHLANAYQDPQMAGGTQYARPQPFFENNRSQLNLPPFKCKSGNPNDKLKKKNYHGKLPFVPQQTIDPSVVENSNLHATAGEFIPSSLKALQTAGTNSSASSSENNGRIMLENYDSSTQHSGNLTFHDSNMPKVDHVDTRNKRDKKDRKYDANKKGDSYKQRDTQDAQYQNTNLFKNSVRNQNPKNRRFQNDRYSNTRHYSDNSSNYTSDKDSDRRKWTGNSSVRENFENGSYHGEEDGTQSVEGTVNKHYKTSRHDNTRQSGGAAKYYGDQNYSSHNSEMKYSQTGGKSVRRYFNEDRGERYRDKRDRYSDKYESGIREKKTSYADYNGYKNNYEREERGERSRDKDKSKDKDNSKGIRDKEIENWRYKNDEDVKGGSNMKRLSNKRSEKDDDASQRERLTEQLNRGQLECLVCCDRVRQQDAVWSCSNCYHVLHLKCTKKWAKSSQAENGWRCPACQNVTAAIPEDYFCFCGNTNNPEWNRRDVAHSCGDVCGRLRSKSNCVHKCNLLCHPGPCPPCVAMVTKHCGCGRTSQTLKCSTGTPLVCSATCEKLLNCITHTCERKCHHGDCGDCEKLIHQECYCGKNCRDVACVADVVASYSCESICNKLLECGNHNCKALCHPGLCEPCVLRPEAVSHCCCGQTLLTEPRNSCLDEIPVCEKKCCKRLKCGQPSNPHMCKSNCHQGECPECELTTKVKCRCGNMDKEIPCKELTTKADDARCQKRCIKKRSCGRHKCNQMCCIDIEHICPLPCTHSLSCGRHKCEQTCHKGRCQPCWRSSFEELYCECGAAVIYPPVPCGTRRPTCDRPCSRQHVCDHPVLHNCHSEPTCPPCTVLTQKWCYGKHELRKAVPCHVNEVSCGLACNKPLSCKRHKCITICHPGPCEKPGQVCAQPCTTARELCGHSCSAPCHEGKCPEIPCKEMVKVTCQCGHRTMSRACAENSREFQRIASGILASKMAEMQLGHSVDLEDVLGQGARKQNQLKTLECNEECKMIERNRRLALGLQIVNPDLSGKLMPRYTEFMKQWGKKDPVFCQMVHDKLTELVQLAKISKQKSRSYSFESMNRDKRHFVHEYCEHFGCESQAYDREPKRNIVATAVKDKCWLPSLSLLEMLQRESGQRKVPGPMLNSATASSSLRNVEVLPLPTKKSPKVQSAPATSKSPEPEIDYFDYQG
ncbi:protein shuttle craft isoform X1 [Neodiprion pinetum]|uniref:protein shuttle craft isoform X1 n=2 Tax=Neodiprion pinetum TaxID=441929 RepID=UPI001EDC97DC|nr:protein shuttle craft isoform X1 [Neodiprion pinetum]XP_046479757.1 protein shuttle craft isoform X1 [Neodiprion pinetum]